MGNCRPRFLECLNAVDEFLEDRCRCSCGCNHNHCCEEENLFVPCRPTRPCHPRDCDRPSRIRDCDRPCERDCHCNSFEQMLCSLIGKKVKIAIGSRCGVACILDVQGKSVRVMAVGSGKIIMINSDHISQIREIC